MASSISWFFFYSRLIHHAVSIESMSCPMHKIKASNIKYAYGTDSKETWNVERQPIHGLNNLMYNDAGQNKKHKKNYSYNMVSNIAKGPQKVSCSSECGENILHTSRFYFWKSFVAWYIKAIFLNCIPLALFLGILLLGFNFIYEGGKTLVALSTNAMDLVFVS